MVYQIIPEQNDNPSSSAAQIRENFDQLNNQFSQDHVAFTASSNNGKHTKIEFPSSVAPPTLTVDNQSAIFPFDIGAGIPGLEFIRRVAGNDEVFKLTDLDVVSYNFTVTGTPFVTWWFNTPWKIRFWGGQSTSSYAGDKILPFQVGAGIDPFTNIYIRQAVAYDGNPTNANVSVLGVSNANPIRIFTRAGNPSNVSFLVIGRY